MTNTVDVTVQIEPVKCCKCGVTFGIDSDVRKHLRANGQTFYCTSGHPMWYGESEADKLRSQLAKEAKERERLETQARLWKDQSAAESSRADRAERRRAAAKGQLTKVRNRIAKGVCPCCNRSFENLRRHMQAKHPDYVRQEPEETQDATEPKP